MDAAGAKTGKLLPTGKPVDVIDGVNVTAIDCAIPMVLIRAADLGMTGYEDPQTLSANKDLIERMTRIRIEAGKLMGMGDVKDMVIPKPVLVAPARKGGTLSVRYFMPNECHPALATTGAVGIATAAVTKGSVAYDVAGGLSVPTQIRIEHPMRLPRRAVGNAKRRNNGRTCKDGAQAFRRLCLRQTNRCD